MEEVFRKISDLYFHSKNVKKDTCGFKAQYPLFISICNFTVIIQMELFSNKD
jgi:hypothetical protein